MIMFLMLCFCLSCMCITRFAPCFVILPNFNSGSRGSAEAGMAGKRCCDPPTLSDDVDFEDWEREFKIWQMATDVEKRKQGARIYLSLEGKARENCKTIELTDLEGENGVKVLLEKLKKLYGKDDAQVLFQIIENFMFEIPTKIHKFQNDI